jgi:Neocarzinostatin family
VTSTSSNRTSRPRRSATRRPFRTRLVMAVTSVFVGAALAVAAGPHAAVAQEAPALVVTPANALEDGDVVAVTGGGFEPESVLLLLMCSSDETLGDVSARCSLIGTGARGYDVDANGRFSAEGVGVPVGQIGSNPAATCPPSEAQAGNGVTCSIEAAGRDLSAVATTPVVVAGIQTVNGAAGGQTGTPANLAFTGAGTTLALLGSLAVAAGIVLTWGGLRLDLARNARDRRD